MQSAGDRHRSLRQIAVMQEVRDKAERKKIKLLVLPTGEAIEILNRNPSDTNAVLHVTC